jgi:hypothetical protein
VQAGETTAGIPFFRELSRQVALDPQYGVQGEVDVGVPPGKRITEADEERQSTGGGAKLSLPTFVRHRFNAVTGILSRRIWGRSQVSSRGAPGEEERSQNDSLLIHG